MGLERLVGVIGAVIDVVVLLLVLEPMTVMMCSIDSIKVAMVDLFPMVCNGFLPRKSRTAGNRSLNIMVW